MLPNTAPVKARTNEALFFNEGEYWTLAYMGEFVRLKHTKGLTLISFLLQHPNAEIEVLALMTSMDTSGIPEQSADPRERGRIGAIDRDSGLEARGLGDSGEMLDKEAKKSYWRRLSEARNELTEAKEGGAIDRAETLEAEIEFLTRELKRAVGLGGRDRRYGSISERARLSVTRAIKSALERISDSHRPLGELLKRSIRTGRFCCYLPDPEAPISWRFDGENALATAQGVNHEPLALEDTSPALFEIDTTEFIGRDSEKADILVSLEQANHRRGSIVLISGAAGVGKTRLAAEIGRIASTKGMLVLRGNCYEERETPPYCPFAEILEMALVRPGAPETFRAALGNEVPEWTQLVPHLRHYLPDLPPPPDLPQQPRYYLFNGIAQFMVRATAQRGAVLLIEDLHWADESTLSLLVHLVQRLSDVPVLMLGTYRDAELDLNNPLSKVLGEIRRKHLAKSIRLRGLSEAEVRRMLEALGGQHPPRALTEEIYRETEGNPFFVEEVFKHLKEEGKLFDRSGHFKPDLKISEIEVPQSVRMVIGLRVSRLHDETRRALSAAAVIGRNFTFEVLCAALGAGIDELLTALEEAESAGLITSSWQTREAQFTFSHELVRHSLLGTLSPPRRQRLHLKVVDAIEQVYSGDPDEQVADLANHLWQAGAAADMGKTVHYLGLAGEQAVQRSAYEQALGPLTSALELICKLPDRPSKVRRELEMSMALSLALQASKGLAAPEHEGLNKRMLELSHSLEDRAQAFSVLTLLFSFFLTRGDLASARKTSQDIAEISRDLNAPLFLMHGNLALGMTLFYQGELVSARTNLEQAIAFPREPQSQRSHAADPHILGLCHLAWTLWFLGYSDQALSRIKEAGTLAHEIGEPFGIAYASWFAATVHDLRGEWGSALKLADETLIRAQHQRFPEFVALGTTWRGVAMVSQGSTEQALAEMSDGVTAFFAAGHQLGATALMGNLAKGQLIVGRSDEALATIEKALILADRTGEHFYRSELLRLKGEALLARDAGNRAEACSSFEMAYELAREQRAHSLELRAAMSLGHLMRIEGKQGDARRILAQSFGWFSEGFATDDLNRSRAILNAVN